MTRRKVILVFGLALLLDACGDDGNVATIPFISGTVAGMDWQLQYGRAAINVQDRELSMTLFSRSELSPNACQIVTTNNAHLTITTPSAIGNYTVPGLDANLSFEQPGSLLSFQATSGFIDITEIVGNRVTGVIQANFDDENNIEGRFIAEICN